MSEDGRSHKRRKNPPPGLAHDETGRLVSVCEFDFDTVQQNLFGDDPRSDLHGVTPAEIDRAIEVLRIMLQWIWQDGMKNVDGVKIRAIILCWIFLKELRPLSLTQVARGFGLKKQSLGRWVDLFKRQFPDIKTSHMRNLG